VGTALLLALAAPVLGIRFGQPDAGHTDPSGTQRRAYDLIAEAYGPGVNGPLAVVVPGAEDARALVVVFQWGCGLGLVGLTETQPVVSFVPVFLFAVVFGLSMDFEVFPLSRVREEYVRPATPCSRSPRERLRPRGSSRRLRRSWWRSSRRSSRARSRC
jgi:uncharacterized membrane protein YdfJ with MMPL/SSD domain